MKKINLAISGMTCSACSNGLEKYLNKQEGIQSASVTFTSAHSLWFLYRFAIERGSLKPSKVS